MSRAFILLIAVSLSLVIFFLYPKVQIGDLDLTHHQSNQTLEEHVDGQSSELGTVEKLPKDRRFVLVIPATSPSPDLCKTIVTALALGYPTPVIINWGVDHRTITKWKGGQNLPKIPGFVKYLDAAMHPDADATEKLQEDDLVLMVDAYDVWFQLPAEVLLRRYHEINERANARLRQQWHKKEPLPMNQTIIAASGKNCHPKPRSGSNMHCDQLPQSPLRADLYGPDTDKNETMHHDVRPRYINGGVYIGPAGDMRRLFRRAQQKMEAGIGQGVHLFSEQGIPGEVLGEQEIWRKWRRESDASSDDTMALVDRDFEYHFGLDYSQELSVQTMWMETDDGLLDGDFISLNNQTAIDRYSEALGISPVRLKGVPDDVRAARNPLADVVEAPNWGEMPLYADFFTESVPVIVHHNGLKERRTTWWNKPWFHQRLRQLLTLRLAPAEPVAPLATVDSESGNVTYWAPLAESKDRRPRLMADSAKKPLAKMEFRDVCHYPGGKAPSPGKHWWDEVFRDTKGPLT
ncbi:Fc.00g002060.m01.CDS01 [Cosmosporella sp. VM-42]